MLPNICLPIFSTLMATSIPSTVQMKLPPNVRPPRPVASPASPYRAKACPLKWLHEREAVWITELGRSRGQGVYPKGLLGALR